MGPCIFRTGSTCSALTALVPVFDFVCAPCHTLLCNLDSGLACPPWPLPRRFCANTCDASKVSMREAKVGFWAGIPRQALGLSSKVTSLQLFKPSRHSALTARTCGHDLHAYHRQSARSHSQKLMEMSVASSSFVHTKQQSSSILRLLLPSVWRLAAPASLPKHCSQRCLEAY